MPKTQMAEPEYTLTQAALLLGVPRDRLKYALHTRRHIPRRIVGTVSLVTLAACREALADVRRTGWPIATR